MPKETIRRLSEDVGSLLVAGAHLAAASSDLAKDKQALDSLAKQLGDKAPVIGQLAEAAGRAIAGKDPADVVSLAARVSQVRAAQADLAGAEGDAVPLPPAMELGTPCNAHDLYELKEALTQSGSGREERLRAALSSGEIADLRLVEAVLSGIADSYMGECVIRDVVPRFGKALVGPMRREFDPNGSAVDARCLRALVQLEGEAARDLVEAALKDGSPPMRSAAFEALAEHLPGRAEFEPLALETVKKDKSADVKRSAIKALRGYGSEASLEALLAALDPSTTRHQAAWALERNAHPQAVPRLLAKLDEALALAAQKDPKKDDDRRDLVRSVLSALAEHDDPKITARVVPLIETYGGPAAKAAVKSGDRKILQSVADQLLSDDVELFGPAVQACTRLGGKDSFERLSAAYTAKDRNTDAGTRRFEAVERAIPKGDRAWSEFLLEVVNYDLAIGAGAKLKKFFGGKDGKPGAGTARAIHALGRLGDRAAAKPLVKALAAAQTREFKVVVIEALGELKDPSVQDAILETMKGQSDWYLSWAGQSALIKLGDPGVVAKVRSMFVSMKEGSQNQAYFERLLKSLEAAFPGQ
jgi:HEAT repeat protein